MTNVVLDKIKTRGYWRINFRPMVISEKIPTPTECEEVVATNSVELRGWHYPPVLRGAQHVARRAGMDFWELSDAWEDHLEFWRMYKSAQFIHYRGLREDWIGEGRSSGSAGVAPGTALAVVNTIYQVTEIYEFAARLARAGLYDEGVEIDIQLGPTTNRELWLDDPARVEFSYSRSTAAEKLTWHRAHKLDELIEYSQVSARELLKGWFAAFAWDVPDEILIRDQEKLLKRQF